MSKYYLFQDTKRCIGCYSCEVHCKANKNLSVGPRLSQIIAMGPRVVKNLPRMSYVFMPCFHCEQPWCVSACPTGAMQKRPKDGIVFVDPALCVGCKTCISACPWGAPQWNEETGTVVKCDYCMDRVDAGLEPACVRKCVTKCLHFGKVEDAVQVRRRRHAAAVATFE
jgi:DMSO reductase iron-sulfur subunit